MLKSSFSLALLFVLSTVSAQIPHYDYFPASFCKVQGIRSVAVYRTKVDSLTKKTNPDKMIRVAKDAIRYWEFDSLGRKVTHNVLLEGSAKSQQDFKFFYEGGNLVREEMEYFNTNNAGTKNMFLQQLHYIYYDTMARISHKVGYFYDPNERVPLDSTSYLRDANGRVVQESWFYNPKYSKEITEIRYSYSAGKIVESKYVDQNIRNRDEYLLDSGGRITQATNYPPNDKVRLQTNYSYDAEGRLIQLDCVPDWEFFQRDRTVVRQTISYDSKGKPIEARLQYGDGKYELELYDYTFISEE